MSERICNQKLVVGVSGSSLPCIAYEESVQKRLELYGGTNSGKTTLVERLVPALSPHHCFVLHIDDYYVGERDERLTYIPQLDHHNWDELNAIKMDEVVSFVTEWKDSVCNDNECSDKMEILLVEGILIYNYRPLFELFDKRYFLTVSENCCRDRRSKRDDYVPPDVPGYYDLVVWPCYQKYLKEIQHHTNINFYDSCRSKEQIYSAVYNDLIETLKST